MPARWRQLKQAWTALMGSAGAALWTVFSCGPSMQSIHEGNVRFEHCYRLDLDPQIAPSHRQACWREWSERYTYGQSGDRIGYAQHRAREIASGKVGLALRLDAGVPAATDGATTPAVAAAPMSPHAPPPAVAPLAKAPVDAGVAPIDAAPSTADAAVPPPAADCSEDCLDRLGRCRTERCENAGKGRCERCERDYRACMRRCFK
jgi:hypothetical protein